MKFGDYLRQKREARGWTQPDAALKAGIEQSYLSKLETGKSYPSEEVYARLVAAYEIDADDLVRQVEAGEFAKLREIGQVRTAVLEVQNGQRTFARGWMIAGLVCLVTSGACLGLFLLAKDTVHTNINYEYLSRGVLKPNESLEAFQVIYFPHTSIELTSEEEKFQAGRNAMVARLDEKRIILNESRGRFFLEKAGEGLRRYDLWDQHEVRIASPLSWSLVPALAFLAATIGCGFISFRWK
jgi:transcriptional regulator with XRE-family HTH domain